MRIDAHQHFWKFDPIRDSWITDEMAVIQKDFLPKNFQTVLEKNNFDGSVVVQSDQSEKENEFQLTNAKQNDFIKGVVGWVDLQANDIEERLAYYSSFKKIKGFRHELSSAREEGQREARADSGQRRQRSADALDSRPQASRLRLFSPQRACGGRNRLRHLPWPHRRDGNGHPDEAPEHGLVSRMPQQPRSLPTPGL